MTRFVADDDWFRVLPRSIRSEVVKRTAVRRFSAGSEIGRAGDAPQHALRLVSGYVRLARLNENGQRASLAIYLPGHCFAERAILTGRRLGHTTSALVDCEVAMLPKRDFLDLYARHREIPEALCKGFSRIIAKQAIAREFDGTVKLRGRIEEMFAEFARTCGSPEEDGYVPIGFPLSQSDIAELLGVTRQSVQLELSALRGAGFVFKRANRWWVRHRSERADRSFFREMQGT